MKRSITLVIYLLLLSKSNAQVPTLSITNGIFPAVLNVSGGSYDNALSYFRYEWSAGELTIIHALSPGDSSFMITHGVLQPCTEQVGYSPYTLLFESSDYKLFPNPTTGLIEFDLLLHTPGQMKLQLINSIGQLLEKRSYVYNGCCRIEHFDLRKYANGTYFIVADLEPFESRDGIKINRHGGFKVVKID